MRYDTHLFIHRWLRTVTQTFKECQSFFFKKKKQVFFFFRVCPPSSSPPFPFLTRPCLKVLFNAGNSKGIAPTTRKGVSCSSLWASRSNWGHPFFLLPNMAEKVDKFIYHASLGMSLLRIQETPSSSSSSSPGPFNDAKKEATSFTLPPDLVV